jgi:very-short-patch-repair endonuclease
MKSHRLRDARHRRLARMAADQAGVVSRRQCYAIGITRWEIRAHVRAGRWQLIGDQSIVLHTGSVSTLGMMWAAVFQGGPRAHLDGASALIASGLARFDAPRIRVTVPRGAKVRRTPLFDIRQTRRWDAATVIRTGIPRAEPSVAAVRGALWARSNKQAVLVLTMAVQQGLTTPDAVSVAALAVRKDRRRRLVHAVALDLLGGARSLGELDFAKECRRRRLPEPSRQVLRRDNRGHYYLDVVWDAWGLVVEIDGIQHSWVENIVGDALRQNAVSLQGLTVLRLPLLGLRIAREEFFSQIEQALREAGCRSQPDPVRCVIRMVASKHQFV